MTLYVIGSFLPALAARDRVNSVLTLQVSTASLPHDRELFVSTCSLYTCVCAGSRRVRVRLSGF
jgi:hypothetical protein